MERFGIRVCVALLGLVVAHESQAALIVEYNFDDGNAVANVVHADVTASNFDGGSGVNFVSYADANAGGRGFRTASAAAALTAMDYWQFTVTAVPGRALNLTNLTFDEIREASGPANFQVQVNGTLLGELTSLTTTSARDLDLSAFTGLSSATIRFVGYNDANSGTSSDWFIDNVQLNGSSVPEPSALLMASVLIPGILAYRRRKQSTSAAADRIAA